ncbi:hypothetical protein [Devosia sediminis]|uniref:Uncharacterized protein n=1 Tax=Devosia sediminis TaxID=2798801 RepID=A0A934IMK8_9HYPH|nr:hypothetical protein [Devosia sediminis]MBJ3783519.1 hypothetical protein [Devosia sediminis]
MIPASYMFKDAFQQSFYENPDIAAAAERQRQTQPGRPILTRWLQALKGKAAARRDERLPEVFGHL